MSRTVQVPYPIVQAEMFRPVTNPISPYKKEWVNTFGDKCSVLAVRTPNHYELMSFLVFLHVTQKYGVEKIKIDENRYKVTFPMRYMYEILKCESSSQRQELWESLVRLSQMSFRIKYENPKKHNNTEELVFAGLTGDLQLLRQRGRNGNILVAKPLRELIDNKMLTVDVTRLLALQTPLAKITAFYLSGRQHASMTWREWMYSISTATYLKGFKQKFAKTLREMEAQKYKVTVIGDKVKLER